MVARVMRLAVLATAINEYVLDTQITYSSFAEHFDVLSEALRAAAYRRTWELQRIQPR